MFFHHLLTIETQFFKLENIEFHYSHVECVFRIEYYYSIGDMTGH